jgi:hypothetical protein
VTGTVILFLHAQFIYFRLSLWSGFYKVDCTYICMPYDVESESMIIKKILKSSISFPEKRKKIEIP